MNTSQESTRRREALAKELDDEIASELNLAIWCHRGSLFLMAFALTCSILAGVLGFFTNASSKVVGGFAVLPPLIAFVAAHLKLEGKNSWHARMVDGLRGLRSRLLYQQPEIPTLDQIAKIAKERQELEVKMQAEFDRTLLLNWSGFTAHRATTHQATESSAPPSRD